MVKEKIAETSIRKLLTCPSLAIWEREFLHLIKHRYPTPGESVVLKQIKQKACTACPKQLTLPI